MALYRVIANFAIATGGVVVRAFFQAYQQVIAKGGRSSAVQEAATNFASRLSRRVPRDEAFKILNLETRADITHPTFRKLLDERFQHLFDQNDVSKGGSFYIQSKVFRAKQAIDEEIMEALKGNVPLQTEDPSASQSSASATSSSSSSSQSETKQ